MIVEVASTRIKFDPSFFALVCIMLVFCEQRTVVLSLICSLCHECGHLIVMFCFKDIPEKITVSAFGMRIDRKNTPLSYRQEALVCMGGIIINIIFVLVSLAVYAATVNTAAIEIAFINVFIAFVNMIPVGMLDFARALNCILLLFYDIKKSQKISDTLSAVFVVGFVICCVLYCTLIKLNISLVAVTVYLVTSYRKRS